MTTAIIVQARMGSTRLCGKVLMDVGGKTVLDHVMTRCRAVAGGDVVCCAIPDTADSDPVAAEARRLGIAVFRGSESDVLDRYWRAARALKADVVMRITSDCPLIDPAVAAEVLGLRARDGLDYTCNNMPPTWPHGLDCEAMTFAWLDRAAREASKPHDREHVTPFIRAHPDSRKANLPCPIAGVAKHRWTLDTPADLAFMRALFPRLPAGPAGHNWRAALALVEADPALAHVDESRA
ncbi:MAG: spore coat polysaccharide biosynthesis protein F [Rhodospirillales bacterium]|nr:spore coat polysaccharide biosynthesis protein F [Rhodospirillales bacterium]